MDKTTDKVPDIAAWTNTTIDRLHQDRIPFQLGQTLSLIVVAVSLKDCGACHITNWTDHSVG